MAYTPFDGTKPTTAQTRQAAITSILQNGLALRDMLLIGDMPGFNYSVSGGTADQPTYMLWTKSTEIVRATLTWGNSGGADGNPTVIVWAYSSNSGGAYDTIGTCTYAYDTNGNLTTTTWS